MAKKRKGKGDMKASARFNSIGATDIRRHRGEVVTENVEVMNDNGTRTLLYNVDRVHNQLQRLRNRNLISVVEYLAGERFSRDYEAGELGLQSCLNPDKVPGSGSEFTPPLIGGYAASRAKAALGNLTGIMVAVVVEGRAPADWAEAHGMKPKTGIDILHWALDILVSHYRLDGEGPSAVSALLR